MSSPATTASHALWVIALVQRYLADGEAGAARPIQTPTSPAQAVPAAPWRSWSALRVTAPDDRSRTYCGLFADSS